MVVAAAAISDGMMVTHSSRGGLVNGYGSSKSGDNDLLSTPPPILFPNRYPNCRVVACSLFRNEILSVECAAIEIASARIGVAAVASEQLE